MNGTIVKITDHSAKLIIADEHTSSKLVLNDDQVKILSVGEQGPQGADGVGGSLVEDDPSPSLGGDLVLGPYNIVGQLENPDFVIDGGLI